jgi:hypothetical protein
MEQALSFVWSDQAAPDGVLNELFHVVDLKLGDACTCADDAHHGVRHGVAENAGDTGNGF